MKQKLFSFGCFVLAASSAFAQSPFEYSGTCKLGTISALRKTSSNRNYVQKGVGIVFQIKKDSSLRVLTPAHVVEGASQFQFQCEDLKLNLSLLGKSTALDLAVLAFPTESADRRIKAFFISDEVSRRNIPDEAIFENDFLAHKRGSRDVSLTQRHGVVWLPSSSSTVGFQTRIHRLDTKYWPGYKNPLLLVDTGVAPGMSGAPIAPMTDTRYKGEETVPSFIGMVVKTESNAPRTLGLNFQEFREHLPLLEKGLDPWQLQNPAGPRIEYVFEDAPQISKRYRILRFPDGVRTLSENCPSGRFSETLDWSPVSGGSWGDGGGGSWGDGGGTLFRDIFSGIARWGAERASLLARKSICEEEGVRSESGQQRHSFLDPRNKRFLRATQLEDWLQLWQKHGEKIFDQPGTEINSDYRALCRGSSWGAVPSLKSVHASGFDYPSSTSEGRRIDYSSILMRSKRGWSKGSGAFCRGATLHIEHQDVWQFKEQADPNSGSTRTGADDFRASIKIGPEWIEGEIFALEKQINFKQKRKTFWTHKIEITDGVILLEIDSDSKLFHLAYFPTAADSKHLIFSRSWFESPDVEGPP